MGGVSLSSHIENSSEDMQEVRKNEERSAENVKECEGENTQESLILDKMHLKPHTLPLRY